MVQTCEGFIISGTVIEEYLFVAATAGQQISLPIISSAFEILFVLLEKFFSWRIMALLCRSYNVSGCMLIRRYDHGHCSRICQANYFAVMRFNIL